MKRARWVIGLMVAIVIVWLWSFCHAQDLDVMNLPAMSAPVVDYSNTLTPEQLDQLNMIAIWLQSWYQWAQVSTVIISDRGWHELYDIGLQIARSNGLGQESLNNGLLLVIAKDEKKLRIMVGYGLEWVIPDILARQIIEQNLRPLVDQWDIYAAVQTWYRVVPQYLIPWSQPDRLQQSNWFEMLWMFALFIAAGLIGWWGYLWSKLWDYLNGEETRDQLTQLTGKSGFSTYSWILWMVMFLAWVTMWFMTFVIVSWVVWFVLGTLGSYTRVISPNFWQSIKQQMNRSLGRWGWFGWGFGGWGGWGWRSGGWGGFGGWGAGD